MTSSADTVAHPPPANGFLMRCAAAMPRIFVPLFALLFYAFSICFVVAALVDFAVPVFQSGNLLSGLMNGLVAGLHASVVALAVYEFAEIIHQEYDPKSRSPKDALVHIRRGLTRFGSVVIIALVLESLIMVIHYGQENLAGYLYYPAAIILSASVLLTALGVFVKLTRVERHATGESVPSADGHASLHKPLEASSHERGEGGDAPWDAQHRIQARDSR